MLVVAEIKWHRESPNTQHFRLNQQTQQCYYYCALFFYSRVLKENFCLGSNTTQQNCLVPFTHSQSKSESVSLIWLTLSLSLSHLHTQQCSMCGKLARIEERERRENAESGEIHRIQQGDNSLLYKHRESTRALNYQGGQQSESKRKWVDWLTDWPVQKKRERSHRKKNKNKKGWQKRERITRVPKFRGNVLFLFSFHFNPSKLSKLLLFRRSFSYITISLSTRISSWSAVSAAAAAAAAAKTPAKLPLARAHTRAQLFLTLFLKLLLQQQQQTHSPLSNCVTLFFWHTFTTTAAAVYLANYIITTLLLHYFS